MIAAAQLKMVARGRLKDAQVLVKARRYDGAFYLCGYAVEIALKARICRTLKWVGFPETGPEFTGRQAVKTHDLEVLLAFSGREGQIKSGSMAEWSALLDWNPDKRYRPIGQATKQQATEIVTCAKRLLEVL